MRGAACRDQTNPLLHDAGDEAGLTRKPIELGDQDVGIVPLGMSDCPPQFRPLIILPDWTS